MIDILDFKERIATGILLGESHYREFKSALEGPPGAKKPRPAKDIASDIARTLVAFANTEGGELFVGVEDNGEISGINRLSDDGQNILFKAFSTHVLASTPLENCISKVVEVEEKLVGYFSVEKSPLRIHQTSIGQVLQRIDGESKPVDIQKIEFERQEQRSREFDRSFERAAKVTDLNMDLLRYVADSVAGGMSIEKCLQYLDLAEYYSGRLNLRKAALLLFANDIRNWFPQCCVRVLRIRGAKLETASARSYNVLRDESVSNNILKLINEGWIALRPYLAVDRFHEDLTFRESVLYPEDACREALINALAHRDYTIAGRPTEIFVYDDRIEVRSPGGLLCNVSIDGLLKLKGLHESRNPYITRVLREIGHMRELGEGIKRMFDSMRGHELRSPELNSDANNFNVVLFNQSIIPKRDQLWLDEYRGCALSTDERLILLLGKKRGALSENDIHKLFPHERFDLTHLLISRMRSKGLLKIDTSVNLKNAKKRREIKNLEIVSPSTVRPSIVDLDDKLRGMPVVPEISNQVANRLKKVLHESSIYKQSVNLCKSLEYLGYIDEDRVPTDKLIGLWPKYQELPKDRIDVIPARPIPTKTLKNAISRANKGRGNAWAKLTEVGALLQAAHPTFAPMDYGFRGLAELVEACGDVFEIRRNDEEILVRQKNRPTQQDSLQRSKDKDYVSLLSEAYNKLSKVGGWVFLGLLISELKRKDKAFTPHSVGYRRFSDWLESISNVFEIRKDGIPGGAQSIFIRKRRILKQPNTQNLRYPNVAEKAVPQGLLIDAFRNTRQNEGWIYLGDFGTKLRQLYPGFHHSSYGFKSMTDLVQAQKDLFETRHESNPNGPPSAFVKLITARMSANSTAPVPAERKSQIGEGKESESRTKDLDRAIEEAYAVCDNVNGEVFLIDLDRVFRERSPNVEFLKEGYTSLHDYLVKSSGFSVVESGIVKETKVRRIGPLDAQQKIKFPLTAIRNSFEKVSLGREAITIDELSQALTMMDIGFHALDYGYNTLIDFLKENSDMFDVFSDDEGGKTLVRLRYY